MCFVTTDLKLDYEPTSLHLRHGHKRSVTPIRYLRVWVLIVPSHKQGLDLRIQKFTCGLE